jgi:phospholipid/cholesterol/gamma-HCH transport system substrate-binding protein
MADERRLQIRIGAFVALVGAALALLVTSLERSESPFARSYMLFADFNDVSGLFVSAPVLLAGDAVGRVRRISFLPLGSPRAVRVELSLDPEVRGLVRSDSTASVYASGLLGDMHVSLSLGSEQGEPLPDGAVLATQEPVPFHELTLRASEALREVTALAATSREVASGLREALDEQALADTAQALARVLREVERGDGLLHQLIYADVEGDPQQLRSIVTRLGSALERVDQILGQVQSGHALAHQLIYGPVPGAPSALASVERSALLLEEVLRKLDEGDGSLGALLNDPSVYEELKLLLSGAQQSLLLRSLIQLAR